MLGPQCVPRHLEKRKKSLNLCKTVIYAPFDNETVTLAERPGRSFATSGWPASKRRRNGTRWTIFVKLPTRGSKGSSATRNLGGAIGIAVVNTWLTDFARIHTANLSAGVGRAPDKARALVEGLTQYAGDWTPDASHALQMAQAELGQIVAAKPPPSPSPTPTGSWLGCSSEP